VLDLIAEVGRGSPEAIWALGEEPLVLALFDDPEVRAAIAAIDLVAIADAARARGRESRLALAWTWAPLAGTLALDATLADAAAWSPAVDGAFAWPGGSRFAAARAELAPSPAGRLALRVRSSARSTVLLDDRPVPAHRDGDAVACEVDGDRHRLLVLLDGADGARTCVLELVRCERP
jgi:hypothetical protein